MKSTCRIKVETAGASVPIEVSVSEFKFYLSTLEHLGFLLLTSEVMYGCVVKIEYYVLDKGRNKNYIGVRYIYNYGEE